MSLQGEQEQCTRTQESNTSGGNVGGPNVYGRLYAHLRTRGAASNWRQNGEIQVYLTPHVSVSGSPAILAFLFFHCFICPVHFS